MTRAINLILQFKFLKSFSFSILAQPTLFILGLILIIDLKDLITKEDILSKFLNIITKHYHLILIYLLISWLFNIINNI